MSSLKIPDPSITKTSHSIHSTKIAKKIKIINAIAISIIITLSAVATISFAGGTAILLTGLFLEVLSLELAIIIALIAHAFSLLIAMICIGVRLLNLLIVKKLPKKKPLKENPIQNPITPQKKEKPLLTIDTRNYLNGLVEIKKYFETKDPNFSLLSISLNIGQEELKKAYENKKLDPIFKNVKKLQVVYKDTEINEKFLNRFVNLEELTFLIFPKKDVTIKTGTFKNFPLLKKLWLFNSSIKKIEENCFPKSIELIDLSNNEIANFSTIFQNLLNLKRLNLPNNPIESKNVNENCFKGSFKTNKNPRINFYNCPGLENFRLKNFDIITKKQHPNIHTYGLFYIENPIFLNF